MDLFKAVVLGVLQGLTEFLPISSSAHLRIFPELFGWGDPGAAFTAVIQIGTELAVANDGEELIVAEIDYERVRQARRLLPTVRDSNISLVLRETEA